jgi:hypothetical protein
MEQYSSERDPPALCKNLVNFVESFLDGESCSIKTAQHSVPGDHRDNAPAKKEYTVLKSIPSKWLGLVPSGGGYPGKLRQDFPYPLSRIFGRVLRERQPLGRIREMIS